MSTHSSVLLTLLSKRLRKNAAMKDVLRSTFWPKPTKVYSTVREVSDAPIDLSAFKNGSFSRSMIDDGARVTPAADNLHKLYEHPDVNVLVRRFPHQLELTNGQRTQSFRLADGRRLDVTHKQFTSADGRARFAPPTITLSNDPVDGLEDLDITGPRTFFATRKGPIENLPRDERVIHENTPIRHIPRKILTSTGVGAAGAAAGHQILGNDTSEGSSTAVS